MEIFKIVDKAIALESAALWQKYLKREDIYLSMSSSHPHLNLPEADNERNLGYYAFWMLRSCYYLLTNEEWGITEYPIMTLELPSEIKELKKHCTWSLLSDELSSKYRHIDFGMASSYDGRHLSFDAQTLLGEEWED